MLAITSKKDSEPLPLAVSPPTFDPGALTLAIGAELRDAEIVHLVEPGLTITSWHNTITLDRDGERSLIRIPQPLLHRALGNFRLVRRALRLDRMNVVVTGRDHDQLVILRAGQAWHYDMRSETLSPTLQMEHCRTVLLGAIEVLEGDEVVFGEYGPSGAHEPVPIYRSTDAGRSWHRAYEFAPGTVRHVHGCYWDSVEHKYWILTGDSDEESRVLTVSRDFTQIELVGTGSQHWRACSVLFEADKVVWIMDSERSDSHLVTLDRATRSITIGQVFPGPVWYTKRLRDGLYLCATTCEKGAGVHDDFAHLFVSRDLADWFEVGRFRWDGLPKGWFKFGVVSFAAGEHSSDEFYISTEALRELDGRSWRCSLRPVS